MHVAQFQEMYELEETYWWFVARRRLVRALIERYAPERDQLQILDAGCGTGGTLAALEGLGELYGCDLSDYALKMCHERGYSKMVLGRAQQLGFKEAEFDVVVSCDVLEHIEQDTQAMQEIARVLSPGGICVITAPAFRFLWSEHDEALHHVRRYETRDLVELVKEADLHIEKLTHAVGLTLPAIILYRLWRRLRRSMHETPRTALVKLPGPLNRLLIWMLGIEQRLMSFISLPLGASLVLVARKPRVREVDKGAAAAVP